VAFAILRRFLHQVLWAVDPRMRVDLSDPPLFIFNKLHRLLLDTL
jgi:hypothetical protein